MKRILALCLFASSAVYAVPLNFDEYRRVAANGGLHLRTGPSVTATSIGLVPESAFVRFLSEAESSTQIGNKSGKWTKVRFGRLEGWVFGAFLQKAEAFVYEPTGNPDAVLKRRLNESLDCTGLTYSEYAAEMNFKGNGQFHYVLGGVTFLPCNSEQPGPDDGFNGEIVEEISGLYRVDGNRIIVSNIEGTKKYNHMQKCRFPAPSPERLNFPETLIFFPVQCRDLKGHSYPAVVSHNFGYRRDLIWVFNKEMQL